jgi:hypothetical protein
MRALGRRHDPFGMEGLVSGHLGGMNDMCVRPGLDSPASVSDG